MLIHVIQGFAKYYRDNIHKEIGRTARWALKAAFSELELATTNASESFNAMLKRLQDWKSRPVDVVALSLYQLDSFYLAEILRGRYQMGEFYLRKHLIPLYSVTIDAPQAIIPSTTRPEDSVVLPSH
jgi:hypothetical protein